ncbi:toll/interleukin-1 receptor domain-containing protein [uncultured Methanolobus sp.]|uniref:toll/interleukin-1 receptor domain-containing protein n=1 Tax=uncultured Methanolobus sp. TaxID=218300 RepID=UPI002AAB7859|nr:toll/interleukin-1 receptor domain-containing protein [uncultured Methanolobus sp.]
MTTDHKIPKEIDRYFATLSKIYEHDGSEKLQRLVVNAKISVQAEWSYRFEFNEDFFGHAVYLHLPASLYATSFVKKEELQNKLRDDLNSIQHVKNEYIDEVFLEMDVPEEVDWRKESQVQLDKKITVSPIDERRIWNNGTFKLFLSHKSEVKKETGTLKEILKMYGISCFVAHEDIEPTNEWQEEIEKALASMDGFVALLTENFHESNWTDQEVGFAFGRGIPIIALKLERDPYGFIGKFQALSCTWESAATKIVSILIKYEKMIDAYVNAVKDCENFDSANALFKIMENITSLSEKQISTLISAFNDNEQIKHSYGFSGRRSRSNPYGSNSYNNETGLVYHLNRLSDKQYEYAKIEEKITIDNQEHSMHVMKIREKQ